MKDKGYTLIELLGVMIILAVLIAFVIPSVINFIKSSTEEKDKLTNDLIINAAKLYVEENNTKYQKIYGNTYCISLNSLAESDYLKDNIVEHINKKTVQISYKGTFKYEIVDSDSCNQIAVKLESNLTPVIYNGENWIVADVLKEQWFNYDNQEWANVVILDGNVKKRIGDIVTVEGDNPDALAMFVWIPRYEYKYTNLGDEFAGGGKDQPGEIEIHFVSKNTTKASKGYSVHPAFTFGVEELSGIWIGKFEISHTTLSTSATSNNLACSNETCEIADGLRILPNVASLRYNNVSNFFYAIRSMERRGNAFGIDASIINAHMMKNSEWGAVAYLSQSKYGKYGNSSYTGTNKEIYQNKSSDYITGSSNGTPSSGTTNTQCTYNDTTDNCGIGASTTGNIYGIYDMSGGAWDRVMGVFANSNGDLWSGNSASSNSGFDGKVGDSGTDYDGVSFPTSEYYDIYKGISDTYEASIKTACSGGICYGHALSETFNWYRDGMEFVSGVTPWVYRGGAIGNNNEAGVFYSHATKGGDTAYASTRVVLVSNT